MEEKTGKIRLAKERRFFALLPAVLEGVFQKKIPLDRFLQNFFRANPGCGSRDRREISGFFYTLFRHWGAVKRVCTLPEIPGEEETARLILSLFLIEGKEEPPLLSCGKLGMDLSLYQELLQENSWEKRLEKWSLFPGNTPYTFEPSHLVPEWMREFFAFPEDPRYFSLPLARARSYCRLRSLSDREKVEKEFASLGKKILFHPRIPHAFYWEGEGNITYKNMESYRKGAFEVQDLSSQLIALWALLPEGVENGSILDYCCGAGGKTLLLASRLKEKGRIFYHDIRKEILAELEKRLTRGGFHNAAYWKKQGERFDLVLVDAPCSSSGRIKHSPELWWLLSPEKIRDCGKKQLEILEEASSFVREGGYLCYGTCSLFTVENELLAENFMKNNPDFERVPLASPLTGEKLPFLRILPWDGECDGSFTVLFRKKESSLLPS